MESSICGVSQTDTEKPDGDPEVAWTGGATYHGCIY